MGLTKGSCIMRWSRLTTGICSVWAYTNSRLIHIWGRWVSFPRQRNSFSSSTILLKPKLGNTSADSPQSFLSKCRNTYFSSNSQRSTRTYYIEAIGYSSYSKTMSRCQRVLKKCCQTSTQRKISVSSRRILVSIKSSRGCTHCLASQADSNSWRSCNLLLARQ